MIPTEQVIVKIFLVVIFLRRSLKLFLFVFKRWSFAVIQVSDSFIIHYNQHSTLDNLSKSDQYTKIANELLFLRKESVPTGVYATVLSCLCGLCRFGKCMNSIIANLPVEMVTSLINDYENVPSIIRILFLIYAFIMESMILLCVELVLIDREGDARGREKSDY